MQRLLTELNALSNINFDLSRYGIDFVESPRHADPSSCRAHQRNMSDARACAGTECRVPSCDRGRGMRDLGALRESASLQREFIVSIHLLFLSLVPTASPTFLCGVLGRARNQDMNATWKQT